MKRIHAEKAPAAIGPYSHAVASGSHLFLSGQIALDPGTMTLVGTDVKTQTRQVMKNIEAVLEAANLTLGNIIKTTVFLADMNDFPEMNRVYEECLDGHKPARSTIAVSALPKAALVEIESVANMGE